MVSLLKIMTQQLGKVTGSNRDIPVDVNAPSGLAFSMGQQSC